MNDQNLTFRNIVNVMYGEKLASKKLPAEWILKMFHHDSDTLLKRWIDSKEMDFSIYSAPEYVADLIICYHCVSKGSVVGSLKWFNQHRIDLSNMMCFEDYNGLGATTLHLLRSNFLTVTTFNDVEMQINTAVKLRQHFKLDDVSRVENISDRSKIETYDVVYTLETIEHFQEPLKYIQELTSHVLPSGYLVYGSGFREMYPGHFSKYKHGDEMLLPSTISRVVKKFLKENYELVYKGFNNKPLIYQLR